MDRRGLRGSITIFLSLICILFLSLICAAVESARVQGARAQAANITGMGNFSLFGEFEPELLEKYDIFSLDGSYGSGTFSTEKMNQRLQEYISYNVNPRKDLFSAGCFEPWRLELTDSSVPGYTLLTDNKGEPFYQQAVKYMKATAATAAAGKLLEYLRDTEEIKTWEEKYKQSLEQNDSQIGSLEDEKQQRREELEEQAAGGSVPAVTEPAKNPLDEIKKLRKKSTLEIVTWDKQISGKTINIGGLPSRGGLSRGNLEVEKEQSGVLSDALFREYLLTHFSGYVDGQPGAALDYQLEYILGGKNSDKKNLQYVVNRLLLIREGMNYLYCLQEPGISSQAAGLAMTLTGFLGIAPLTEATKHALLLAWAYGESLIDVRTLLDGGRVPIFKDGSTWSLSLENLGRITEILRQGNTGGSQGLRYNDYLRVLLNLGACGSQKMRALDMIQAELRSEKGTESFRVNNCVVAVKTSTNWKCKPVFAGLPAVFLGGSMQGIQIGQEGSISY